MSLLYNFGWLTGQFFIILGLIRKSGLENVPPNGGVILAANHRSYLDPPILGFCLKRETFFLAKRELFQFRPFGWVLWQVNSIPVTRGALDLGAYKKAINHLLFGHSIVLFPEGTRSRGEEFLEPRLGVGLLASQAQVPVVPVYMENTNRIWQVLCRKESIRVRFGNPISTSWIGSQPRNKQGYQNIAQECMLRIKALKEAT